MVVTAGIAIGVDECGALDPIAALPFDGEAGIGLLQVDRFRIPASRQSGCKMVGDVEQPSIAGVRGKQDELTDGDHAPVVLGGLVLDVANLVGQAEALAIHCPPPRPALDGSAAHRFFLSIEYSAWTWNGSSSCLPISWPWSITVSTASSFTDT
jgi:hypothetical protein